MTTTPATPATISDLAGTWKLDPTHSRIGFVARHAMITKVRGAFNDFEGTVTIDGEDLAASRAEVTIQATSIDTRNAQRDEHLRSNDFLAMGEFPTITFASTAVRVTGATELALDGNLTVKGVTKAVTVPFVFEGAASDPFGNLRAGFEGQLAINRADYGITWNAALETGGVLVGEKIVLEFEISAVKSA